MSYSPINVSNPVSLCHIINIWPGQRIELLLEKRLYPKSKVTTNGCIKIDKVDENGPITCWTIVQTDNFEDWSRYSSCYLGEVWIDSDLAVARLAVVLQSSTPSKLDHLTVINPSSDCVKISPHQIVEVVTYDERFGYQDEWTWDWYPGSDGIDICELGSDHLTVFGRQSLAMAQIDDPEYRYARCPRANVSGDDFCRQHHFWFRLDSCVLSVLNKELDFRYLGVLVIRGYSDRLQKHIAQTVDYKVTLYADLKSRFRQQVIRTLGAPGRAFDTMLPRKWSGFTSKSKKPNYLYVQDVSISKVSLDIDEDCKTTIAIPPERSKRVQYDYDYDDDYYFIGSEYKSLVPIHKKCSEWSK